MLNLEHKPWKLSFNLDYKIYSTTPFLSLYMLTSYHVHNLIY